MMLTLAAGSSQEVPADRSTRRVAAVWALLFVNTIGFAKPTTVLPLPHKVGQLVTQGALVAALILALTVNRKVVVRGSWFLGLYTVLGITSVMMSVRFVSLGTAYRGFRLMTFLAVLWLLTPWWRDRRWVLLRTQLLVLTIILVSLLIGIMISPSQAFALNYNSARLNGVVWPMTAPQVAHYMAELTGVTILLWLSGMIRRRPALLLIGGGAVALIATHTRTALGGLLIGLLMGGASLFFAKRRIRKAFAVCLVVILTIVLPLLPLITSWLERGQSAKSLQDLSGRTKTWALVFSESRPETNKILGSGMTNDGVINQGPGSNGLPIDNSWIATYQNQGIVGCVLEAFMFFVLLLAALLSPRGPGRAVALFLISYCLFASYTDTGMGEPSIYLLDLTLAASLLVPRTRSHQKDALLPA
ncbi:MAG: O-antigen ligase domain-containing protein [Actinomycetota bacterium]|nr:O-antigen ligase domain-containing protein [Actinomycetota bacterium]